MSLEFQYIRTTLDIKFSRKAVGVSNA